MNLQFTMLRFIFSTPASTPKAALLWDTGILPMEQQIELKKMMFLHHLSTLPEGTLANQIYTQQKENHFPGLVTECLKLVEKYDLPNIIGGDNSAKDVYKNMIKTKLKESVSDKLKHEIESMSKLESINAKSENYEAKPYLAELNLAQARTKFKLRSRMIEVKNNYKGKHANLECEACERSLETQDHILFCPAYSELRSNKDLSNDTDLVNYFRDVLVFREKLKK